jgi:hypothetical protein
MPAEMPAEGKWCESLAAEQAPMRATSSWSSAAMNIRFAV